MVEILLTRTTEEMSLVRAEYFEKHGVQLEIDVADDTSGDFRKTVYPLSMVSMQIFLVLQTSVAT